MVFQTLQTKLTLDKAGFEEGIASAIGSLSGLKKKVGVVGGALAGLGAAGFAVATNEAVKFEDAIVELEKVTDQQTAQKLRDDIKDIATETRLTTGQIADLSAQAARFGAEGPEQIARFTRTAAEMGAATTLGADRASKALAKTATALNEPLENVRNIGSAVNKVSNNVPANSKEIVNSVTRAGATLSDLGLTSEQIIGLSGAMNAVSPNAERAAGLMRRFGESMMEPDNVEVFAEVLGVTTEEFRQMREESPKETILAIGEEFKSSEEDARLMSEELNKRVVRSFRRISGEGDDVRKSMKLAGGSFNNVGSLARENKKDVNTFKGELDLLKSELRGIAIETGSRTLPFMKDLVKEVKGGVEAFGNMNERLDGLPGTIILVGAVVVGLTIALGVLATTISVAVIPGLIALGGTFGTLAGLIASPIVAVLLFAAVLAALVTNVGNFRDKVVAGFLAMGFGVNNAVRATANAVMDIWNEMVRFTVEQTEEFLVAAQRIINAINKIRTARGKEPIQPIATSLDAATFGPEDKFDILGEEEMNAMLDRAAEEGFISEDGRFSGSDPEDGLLGATGKTFGDVLSGTGEGLMDALFENPDEIFTDPGDGDGDGMTVAERAKKRRDRLREKLKKQNKELLESMGLSEEQVNKRLETTFGGSGDGTGSDSAGSGTGTVSAFGGLPGPLGDILSGDADSASDLIDTPTTDVPTDIRDGGSGRARGLADAVRRAIDGATLVLEGEDGTEQRGTIETGAGTEQSRRESRLGERNPNL